MRLPWANRKHNGLLNSKERLEFYNRVEHYLPVLAQADKRKLEFAKEFINRLEFKGIEDGDTVQLGPMDWRTFEYFIFTILVEYDYGGWSNEANFNS